MLSGIRGEERRGEERRGEEMIPEGYLRHKTRSRWCDRWDTQWSSERIE